MKIENFIQEQYPGFMVVAGITGFITSVVMTAKSAPKANKILEELDEDAPFLEKVKAVAPVYAPVAGMVLISTACVLASNRAYKNRYASLLAIYSISERRLEKWQNSVLEEIGPKRYEKVRERVVSPPEDASVPTAILLDEDRVLFYDSFSGRYFRTNSVETVRRKINNLNEQLLTGDWVSLNEFYYELGLDPVQFGDDMGWSAYDATIQVNFDSFIKDDRPVISISFVARPKEY